MHDDGTDTIWVEVAPGVKAEVKYRVSEYRTIAHDGETVGGELTGRMRLTGKAIFDNNW